MRAIKYTNRFQRDYKREKSGQLGKKLDVVLMEAVNMLAADTLLARRYFDHPLSGEWSDHRDCHIWPDLVLIYRKPDDHNLELVRLGSHSELGLSASSKEASIGSISPARCKFSKPQMRLSCLRPRLVPAG